MLHDSNLKFQNATPQPYFKDNEKKILPKTWKLTILSHSIILRNSVRNPAHAYAYKAENWCVGVIFDFKQDSHKIFSKFEFFGFFRNQIWYPPFGSQYILNARKPIFSAELHRNMNK